MKKLLGFTLAETLIVMGIIGVVAALTLPNLNSSTGDKEKVVKVKKIYQNLEDAFGRAMVVYGPVDDWFVNDNDATSQRTRFAERLTEFMKISNSTSNSTANIYTLADGTTLKFTSKSMVYFDIDGDNKGKNQETYDIFSIYVENGAFHIEENYDVATCMHWCVNYKIGNACLYWILRFDNMDYLKCPEKLSETNTSCK